MKRFLKIVSALLAFCLLFSVAVSVYIDPYNIFHWKCPQNVEGITTNINYVKTKYLVNFPNKFDSIMLGSSRVGAIHTEKIKSESVYNMYMVNATAQENLETITALTENNVFPKTVFLGVDSLTYTENPKKHEEIGFCCSYYHLKKNPIDFAKLYLNPVIFQSLEPFTLLKLLNPAKKHAEKFKSNLFEHGWWGDYTKGLDNWENLKPSIGDSNLMEEALLSIKEIADICKKNNIKLVVFTNPMCEMTYTASLKVGYKTFLKKLSEITDFYNFSGINEITVNPQNYYDSSHYSAYIGDMIIDTVVNKKTDKKLLKQGFGMYVTKENVDLLLEILNNQEK